MADLEECPVPTIPSVASVIDAIENVYEPADLAAIRAALDRAAPPAAGTTFAVGQRVCISGNVRPRYLAGITGTVTKVNLTRVKVRFDDEALARLSADQRARWSHEPSCPPSLLEAL